MSLLIDDFITQKIMHWVLPSPSEIEDQLGDSEKVKKAFYLMYALTYPKKRRDTTPAARHPYDAAIRDRLRNTGYHLHEKERQLIICHDLPEDIGSSISHAHIISHIIGLALDDTKIIHNLNLLTDHYAFIWKPIKKKAEIREYELMRHISIDEIIDILEKEPAPLVTLEKMKACYQNIIIKIQHFINGVKNIYIAYGKQIPSQLMVHDLKPEEITQITSLLRDVIHKISSHIKKKDLLKSEFLMTCHQQIYDEVCTSFNDLKKEAELTEKSFKPTTIEKQLILSGENPVIQTMTINLYQKYIERLIASISHMVNTSIQPVKDEDILAPVMAKFSDAIDNVRTLPKDNLQSMRSIYQKARCLIKKGMELHSNLESSSIQTERLRQIVRVLFDNLMKKNIEYREGVGNISNLDTSYIETVRLIITMVDKNEKLIKELNL